MEEQVEWDACPKCGSDNLEAEDVDISARILVRRVWCNKCHFVWNETFKFQFNEDPGTGKVLDQYGKVIK